MNQRSFAEILESFTEETNSHPSSEKPIRSTSSATPLFDMTSFLHQSQFEIAQIGLLGSFTEETTSSDLGKKYQQDFAQKKSTFTFAKYKHYQTQQKFEQPKKKSHKQGFQAKHEKSSSPSLSSLPKRQTGPAHKLNELQKQAMTFFINNLEFLLEDFTESELKRSFKKLCFRFHPDFCRSEVQIQKSNDNFIELKNHYENLALVFKPKT